MRRVVVKVAATLLFASALRAADDANLQERHLSLADVSRLALAGNHEIAIEREYMKIGAAGLDRAHGAYDPELRLDIVGRDRTDPANSLLSGTPQDQLGPHVESAATTASLSQLLSSGGTVSFHTSVGIQRSDSFFTTLSPAYSTAVGIEFRQPLLAKPAENDPALAIRIASLEKNRSLDALRGTITESLAAVERAYWDLVAARRRVAVRETSVTLAERQNEDTRERIQGGKLPESDLVETIAEVERRKGELYAAQEAAMRAENHLKELILADPVDPLWNEALIPTDPPETERRPIDLNSALERAAGNRSDRAEAEAVNALRDAELTAARDRTRPELDLFVSYNRRGLAGDKNPEPVPILGSIGAVPDALAGGVGRSFGTVLENRFPDLSAGFAAKFVLRDRATIAATAVAAAQRSAAALLLSRRIQRIDVEVRNAVVALRTAEKRIDAARAGRAAADSQLEAEKARFSAGRSTNFIVLTRQNELAQIALAETDALIDYRKGLVELDRATGTLLEERGVELADEPSSRVP